MRRAQDTHRAGEVLPGPSAPASVVAEIGGERGAAIVHVPPGWLGREVEIRRTGEPWTGRHVAVLARRLPHGDDYSAFFGSLPRGSYEVRCRRALRAPGAASAADVRTVAVVGGGVAELFWDAAVQRQGIVSERARAPRVTGDEKEG